MDNPSLKVLVADLKKLLDTLSADIEGKSWNGAYNRSKAILGLASRLFSRCDGICKALDELAEN